jgi:hypothetical protein
LRTDWDMVSFHGEPLGRTPGGQEQEYPGLGQCAQFTREQGYLPHRMCEADIGFRYEEKLSDQREVGVLSRSSTYRGQIERKVRETRLQLSSKL